MERSDPKITELIDCSEPSLLGPGAVDHSRTDSALLKLMNEARAARSLPPLKHHPALLKAAQSHSQDQADHNQISHYGLAHSSTWADRCREAGYPGADLSTIGENVAAGQISAEQVMGDWMRSPGHRDVILNPKYEHAASASATGSRGWTYWTTDFGCGAPDPAPEPPKDLDYLLV